MINDQRSMSNLRDRLPRANSLIAFEAAARCGSHSAAARELDVTPAAISRQIKRVEDFLGVRVFEPLGRGRALTSEGRELADAVAIGLEHVAGVVSKLRGRSSPSSLKIATPLAFASLWLMPRIVTFRQAHPEIELRFMTSDTDLDPRHEGISLAVRYGSGNWPDLSVLPLLHPHVFPVCTAEYLKNCGRISSIDDLLSQTLLERVGEGSFIVSWTAWLKGAGARPRRAPKFIFFNSYELLIRAALMGQGVALGVDLLVEDLVRQNHLVCPLADKVLWNEAYYLVSPRGETLTPEMELFSEWLIAEARRSPSSAKGGDWQGRLSELVHESRG
jgi:LysR family glycine cleavage system transcriptional activator